MLFRVWIDRGIFEDDLLRNYMSSQMILMRSLGLSKIE